MRSTWYGAVSGRVLASSLRLAVGGATSLTYGKPNVPCRTDRGDTLVADGFYRRGWPDAS